MAEKIARVDEVKALKTQSGNTRYVLRDDEGGEYSTFKEPIAREALAAEGRRARIEFHAQERNGFTNVYLDAVEPLPEDAEATSASDADEVAWKTAMDAAPYLLDGAAVDREVAPDELFQKLQPFKELVADDLRDGGDEGSSAPPD